MTETSPPPEPAAICYGIKVPPSPFLTDKLIRRIEAELYERLEIKGSLRVVRPGDRVLELGAGLGIVGAVVARNARPAEVRSYEANPALIPHIEALYALNDLGGVNSVRNEVLVGGPDRPPALPFHIAGSFLGSSLLPGENRRETVAVPTADLAGVMAGFRPEVLIIDIEGGEQDILRHIDLSGLRAVVIEFHPRAYGYEAMWACKDILRASGIEMVQALSNRKVWTCERPG
jgi:FkbM family methyltransferase